AGVGSGLRMPERITEPGGRAVGYLAIILRGESAPQHGGDTEMMEKLAADVQALGVPGFSSRGKVKARRAPGQNTCKGLLLCPDLFPVAVGETGAARRKPAGARSTAGEIDRQQ